MVEFILYGFGAVLFALALLGGILGERDKMRNERLDREYLERELGKNHLED